MEDAAVLLNGASTRAFLCKRSLAPGTCRQPARKSSAASRSCKGVRAITEGSTSSSSSPSSSEQAQSSQSPPVVCPGCGRAELESGCNGEGRIQGGIGAISGFEWWPIKAFRPCPAFLQSGGRYRRSGQSLNELAFGRKGSGDDLDVSERLKR